MTTHENKPNATPRSRWLRLRLDPHGRAVLAKGPIILGLFVANFIVAACAVLALVSTVVEGGQADQNQRDAIYHNHQLLVRIQHNRVITIEDNCLFLRGIVIAATPKNRRARAKQFIAATPLHDCHAYALRVTGPHPPVLYRIRVHGR